jgi:hypothetical protein
MLKTYITCEVVLSREDGYFLLKKWSWKAHTNITHERHHKIR